GGLLAELASIWYGIIFALIQLPWVLLLERLFRKIFKKSKHQKKLVTVFSVVFAYVILFGIITVIVAGIIPPLASSQDQIKDAFGETLSSTTAFIDRIRNFSSITRLVVDETIQVVKSWATANYSDQALSIAGSLASQALSIVIGVIISIYILLSRPMFNRIFGKISAAYLSSSAIPRVLNFCKRLYTDFTEFIFVRIFGALLVSILTYLSAWIIGIPFYLLIIASIIVFILTLIPIFGPFLANAMAALVLFLLDTSLHAWVLLALMTVFQILRHQLFARFLLRKKLRPSPALSIPLLIIGGGFGGFIGTLVAIPLFATVEIELREIMNRIFVRRGLPFATEEYIGYDFRTASFQDTNQSAEQNAEENVAASEENPDTE
ncbi:MAG: AI-2E family transporter, partial [Clostridia bacterium]|nr:AI-2E family transporter [Clostridia bacterium]